MPRVILPQFPKAHPADLAGKTEGVIDFLEEFVDLQAVNNGKKNLRRW